MGVQSMFILLLTHPGEFRTLVQYYLYHEQKRDITAKRDHETSGWDRKSMRRCWEFLDMTSRSFSAVIKELDGDLARTICLFYLVLRGLDTIEDDMTIPDKIKQPLLRSFHEHTVTPGWSYDGCGPKEKDRQLLVEYQVVVEEVNLLKPEYRAVVLDICRKMETGMADFAHQAAQSTTQMYLNTIQDYDLYCHYVAGLVGEGLSGIWAASGKEHASIGEQLELSSSMGTFLQKTNIIRDIREDADEGRFFWPREIWTRFGYDDLPELCKSGSKESVWALNAMIVDALRHACDGLEYLRLLRNQSVFNFCAIPAAMAIATLALCYNNPEVLQRNVKIRKAQAASLIMRSTNPREVAFMFRDFARQLHAKSVVSDPNFVKVAVACGKIEQWCEVAYPSFVHILQSSSAVSGSSSTQALSKSDVRVRVVEAGQARDRFLATKRRVLELRKNGAVGNSTNGHTANGAAQAESSGVPMDMMVYIFAAFVIVIALTVGIVYSVLWYVGDE